MNMNQEMQTASPSPESPGAAVERAARMTQQLRKTKLCKFDLNGWCKDGSRCSFAHSEEELQAPPVFHKSQLCAFFMDGDCKSGRTCRFAHGAKELRVPGSHQRTSGVQPQAPACYAQYPQPRGGRGASGRQMTGIGYCNDNVPVPPHSDMPEATLTGVCYYIDTVPVPPGLGTTPSSRVAVGRVVEPMPVLEAHVNPCATSPPDGMPWFNPPMHGSAVQEEQVAKLYNVPAPPGLDMPEAQIAGGRVVEPMPVLEAAKLYNVPAPPGLDMPEVLEEQFAKLYKTVLTEIVHGRIIMRF